MLISKDTLKITTMALEFINRIDDDTAKKLLEGECIFGIVESGKNKIPVNKATTDAKYIKTLKQLYSRDEAREYLSKLKLTNVQLIHMAKELAIHIKSGDKKAVIIDKIVEGIVGSKLRMQALGYEEI
ncbi:MAG: hypothetical protein RSD26_12495 [Cellulosilyticaceae bacterium]